MQKARRGVQIADEVGKSLSAITTAATSVNQLVNEISASSKEEAQGIGQVTIAVTQMDKITQTNAASAEESAAAAEQLSSQSEQLRGFVLELSAMMGIVSEQREHTRRPSIIKKQPEFQQQKPQQVKARQQAKDVIPLPDPVNSNDFAEFGKAA